MTVQLETERLLLRPPTEADIPAMIEVLGSDAVYQTTLNIPRPYTPADARAWVERTRGNWASGAAASFSIIRREDGQLVGGMGLRNFDELHAKAEIGFAIGQPFWGMGYATEAGRAVVRYGFAERGLNRIWGGHFEGNEASARVQQKLGFHREGVLRQDLRKDGRWIDSVIWAITRSDWEPGTPAGSAALAEIETERLRLRAPRHADAGAIERIHGHRSFAEGGISIPHPCPAGYGESWIRKVRRSIEEGDAVWVIELRETGEVVGDAGLGIKRAHDRAMLGYGVSHEHRGRGFATEAVSGIVRWGFERCEPPLRTIFADIWISNEPSRRVLEKAGFVREGVLRDHYRKGAVYMTAERYAIVRGG